MDPEVIASAIFTGVGCVFGVVFMAFYIFCFWRIFAKAGYSGALSLLSLIPFVGPIVVLCVLAFGSWPAGPKG